MPMHTSHIAPVHIYWPRTYDHVMHTSTLHKHTTAWPSTHEHAMHTLHIAQAHICLAPHTRTCHAHPPHCTSTQLLGPAHTTMPCIRPTLHPAHSCLAPHIRPTGRACQCIHPTLHKHAMHTSDVKVVIEPPPRYSLDEHYVRPVLPHPPRHGTGANSTTCYTTLIAVYAPCGPCYAFLEEMAILLVEVISIYGRLVWRGCKTSTM